MPQSGSCLAPDIGVDVVDGHDGGMRRLGRSQESRTAYDKAIELADNTAETQG